MHVITILKNDYLEHGSMIAVQWYNNNHMK